MVIQSLLTAKGWRRRGLATLLGFCATLALPPCYLFPLLVPAFAGLFLLITSASSARQAFLDGWWWGLGHFTSGLYWICISLWVEPEKFAWLTPFALFGLPSVLAVYVAGVTLLLYKIQSLRRLSDPWLVIIFAFLWVGAEYARAHWFTGFPWNLIGYSWALSDITLQPAALVGIYGLSWLTVFAAAMPALIAVQGKQSARPVWFATSLVMAFVVFGVLRLATHPTLYTGTRARIVQANVAQTVKWEAGAALDGLKKHIRLTQSPGLEGVNLVLWPETAVPYYLAPGSPLSEKLSHRLPRNALLLTGALRADGTRAGHAWNSMFALDAQGGIVASYDKHHLVPFGEYIPFRGVLPVEAVAGGLGDFDFGPGPRTLAIPPYPPFSPLICYEAIFPGEATDGKGRAEWLFSLTDDAWFGVSSGLYQDLQMAHVRGIEQGLPLLRAANTGISAAFDAYGRTLARLPLETVGILDVDLPKADPAASIFGRYPQSAILFMIGCSAIFYFLLRKKTIS